MGAPVSDWVRAAVLALSGAALLWANLVVLTFPTALAAVLAAVLGALLAGVGGRFAPLLCSVSIGLCLAAGEVVLRALDDKPAYYRPHEIAAGVDRYKPNVTNEGFRVPFGDLFVMSKYSEPALVEPRTVDFFTDSHGFRNQSEYSGQRLILLGDSFAVGVGMDQGDTPAAQLSRELGERVYSLAYPGSPDEYVRTYRAEHHRFAPGHRLIIVIFEGNDFDCYGPGGEIPGPKVWYLDRPNWVRDLEIYRTIFGLSRNAMDNLLRLGVESLVRVETVGDTPMGFFEKYVKVAKQEVNCGWRNFANVFGGIQRDIALVAFVPVKYRVYHDLVDPPDKPPLPNTQEDDLRATLASEGIPYLDLTPYLVEASRKLLPEGRYTFWRDDTHWSPEGVAAAARAIAGALGAGDGVPRE